MVGLIIGDNAVSGDAKDDLSLALPLQMVVKKQRLKNVFLALRAKNTHNARLQFFDGVIE